tara:strand:- start:993 stop:1556 length:564 start_codon:yes stop_codon:yes gene_type:complete
MKVLVGLGNPGRKYSNTKHNFGFWIIDCFLKEGSLELQAGKGDYHYIKTNDFYLVKPMSYMNNSGLALFQFVNYFKINIEDLLIIYDDIDLPLGTIKYKKSGSSGGHRGIESIIYHLKSDNFHRLRLGIATDDIMRPSEKYVLSPFHKTYKKELEDVINNSLDSINYYFKNSIEKTMNIYNKKNREG